MSNLPKFGFLDGNVNFWDDLELCEAVNPFLLVALSSMEVARLRSSPVTSMVNPYNYICFVAQFSALSFPLGPNAPVGDLNSQLVMVHSLDNLENSVLDMELIYVVGVNREELDQWIFRSGQIHVALVVVIRC